ncbi:MAG: HAMP domain-containing histidine kinase [Planctomycetaceae bacterium]|nr:HAMP domain-containing histidine kinase [Planctomycetaceae bacterium]MDO4426069.1 HAMP domain-containing sensor histidine kinase [Planctomycetia bacterium]
MPEQSEYHSLSPELLAEFSAGAGHDLNNPLAAISGRVQLMLREEQDPVKRSDLAVILTQVKRAQDMIADLRLVARPPLPRKKTFSFGEFLEKLRESYAVQFLEQGVEWKAEALGGVFQTGVPGLNFPGFLHADETQMMVLFRALIRNSLRALGGPGTIHLTWRMIPESTLLEIRVMDSGPGISKEIRPFIFDPYFSSYQSGRGLGFGLTKARIIAQMHGGDVTLDETAAQTTFCVTLENLLPEA